MCFFLQEGAPCRLPYKEPCRSLLALSACPICELEAVLQRSGDCDYEHL